MEGGMVKRCFCSWRTVRGSSEALQKNGKNSVRRSGNERGAGAGTKRPSRNAVFEEERGRLPILSLPYQECLGQKKHKVRRVCDRCNGQVWYWP